MSKKSPATQRRLILAFVAALLVSGLGPLPADAQLVDPRLIEPIASQLPQPGGSPSPTAPSPAAATTARDDRLNADKAAWTDVYGLTPLQLSTHLLLNGHRLVSVKVHTASPLVVDAVTIANTGANATAWWWYPALRFEEIAGTITANNARLTQLVPYQSAQGRRFFAVMVSNTGLYRSSWTYYVDVPETILGDIRRGGFLPLAIEGRSKGSAPSGGGRNYENFETIITLANPERLAWNVGPTPYDDQDVRPEVIYRVIDVNGQAKGTGELGQIDVESRFPDTPSYHYTRITPAELKIRVGIYNLRLIDVVRYTDLVSTTDGLEAREFVAATAVSAGPISDQLRLENALRQPPLGTGRASAMLNRAGLTGVIAPAPLSVNSTLGVEPASAIKVLHVLHALRRVQAGTESLDAPFTFYVNSGNFGFGHPNNCPQPAEETVLNRRVITLRRALELTLKNSDNRTTRGLELRYGRSAINATAANAGLSGTRLNSIIGCFDRAAPNTFPAADAAALHAGIHLGTLLAGPARAAFYEAISTYSEAGFYLEAAIRDEGKRLGLSDTVVASFVEKVSISSKGGSYDAGSDHTRSTAGRLVLPVGDTGLFGATRVWTFALLVDNITDNYCCYGLDNAMGTAVADLLRPAVRDALRTYL